MISPYLPGFPEFSDRFLEHVLLLISPAEVKMRPEGLRRGFYDFFAFRDNFIVREHRRDADWNVHSGGQRNPRVPSEGAARLQGLGLCQNNLRRFSVESFTAKIVQ